MKRMLQQWVKKYIVQEVPPQIAVCEFECQKIGCTRSNWSNCQLWKSYNRSIKAELN